MVDWNRRGVAVKKYCVSISGVGRIRNMPIPKPIRVVRYPVNVAANIAGGQPGGRYKVIEIAYIGAGIVGRSTELARLIPVKIKPTAQRSPRRGILVLISIAKCNLLRWVLNVAHFEAQGLVRTMYSLVPEKKIRISTIVGWHEIGIRQHVPRVRRNIGSRKS